MIKKVQREQVLVPGTGGSPAIKRSSEASSGSGSIRVEGDLPSGETTQAHKRLTGVDEAKSSIDPRQIGRPKSEAVEAISEELPKREDAKYDFVFAGGGTAACVAAARMAEAGLRVLVLEAGSDPRVDNPAATDPIESQIPAAHGAASESKRLIVDGTSYKVKHRSDDAKNAEDPNYDPEAKGVQYPRGENIGGSSNVNAMIWVRPDRSDLEAIFKATGNPRWKPENCEKLFQRIESVEYRPVLRAIHEIGKALRIKRLQNPHGLGMDGWLHLNRPSPKILLGDPQLLKMVWQTSKFSFKNLGSLGDKITRLINNLDPNDRSTNQSEGLVNTPLAITKDGRRNGPRQRLFAVRGEHPDRVEIRGSAKVEKVLLDDQNEARGVRYRDANGKVHEVGARHGVIVAGGAFATPQILKWSGIGTKEELAPLGIQPKIELPGVGEGLADRYEYGYTFKLKKPLETLQELQLPLQLLNRLAQSGADPSSIERMDIEAAAEKSPALAQWLEGKGGVLASNGSSIAFQAKSDPSMPEPDLYIFLVPGDFHGYHNNYSAEAGAAIDKVTLVMLHENKTDAEGTVKLNPDNLYGQPLINFKYHEEESKDVDDRLPLARAVQNYGRPLLEAFGDIVEQEVLPGPDLGTLEQIASKIGKGTWGHHANHSARMGPDSDPMTVVNGDLEVAGAKGLYVADASVLHNPGSFIVSSVMLVGEQMADIAIERVNQAKAAEAALALPGAFGLKKT